ncbi:uncharacterized protein LOC114138828 [Xiphophorus couchianus]|uniref:uncharacterized protein LOC114138828 n=1 Tax=Xiphophorus couchianus TaxID=32473 RepID=UPI001016F2D7|nr:uncharacterized protein LOC114138828 [Xiphophorus couchianus]
MILLWVTLLLLHQGYGLVPVITAHLGETTTLTCKLPDTKDRRNKLFWYRQTAGHSLEAVVKLISLANPEYGAGYSDSRVKAVLTDNVSNLTILKAAQEDEGMYHCGFSDWSQNVWRGTYLLIKGNTVVSSKYTVVQTPIISKPLHPGDPVTLQCSVLSSSDSKKCSGDLNLFWIRAGDKSLPNYIYTDGNRENKCEEKLDSQQRCVYNFSKTVNASDATFYCAVATCGEIYFGNGTNIDIKESSLWSQDARKVVILLSAALAVSLVVIALLIYFSLKNKCVHCTADSELQKNISRQKPQERCKDGWIYSAAIFTTIKSDWAGLKKEAEKERIYAAVEAFGLN